MIIKEPFTCYLVMREWYVVPGYAPLDTTYVTNWLENLLNAGRGFKHFINIS
jgi:hypothetical protein